MIVKRVIKHAFMDGEAYVRVGEDRAYRVVVREASTGRVLREHVRRPIVKTVQAGGRLYRYRYIRVHLPFTSTLQRTAGERDRYEIEIVVE